MYGNRITQYTQSSSPLSLSQILLTYKVKSTKHKSNRNPYKQARAHNMQSSFCSRSHSRRSQQKNRNINTTRNRNKSKNLSSRHKTKVNNSVMKCSQEQIRMKQLIQSRYMQSIEYLYKTAIQNNGDSYCRFKTMLTQSSVYFLGSLVQKIKKLNTISQMQFVQQCIKIFHKSSGLDIEQFVSTIQTIMAAKKQYNVTTKRIINSRSNSNDDWIKNVCKQENQRALQQKSLNNNYNSEESYATNNKWSNKLQEIAKVNDTHKNIYIKQDEDTQRTPKKADNKQNTQPIHIKSVPSGFEHNRAVNSLGNIPITSSIQSKKILHTPTDKNIVTESSQLINTPFNKIDQINKNVQKLVDLSRNNDEKVKQYNSGIEKVDKVTGTTQNTYKDNQRILKTLQSSKPCVENSKQKMNQNDHKKTEVDLAQLYSKYKHVPSTISVKKDQYTNNLNSSCTINDSTLSPYHQIQRGIRQYSARKDRSHDDDRIERLTARVQDYIQSNAMKIQSSKLARDLY